MAYNSKIHAIKVLQNGIHRGLCFKNQTMKINKKWLKDNFEQKFYRLTNKCEFSVKRVGSEVDSSYLCRVIKIEGYDKNR